ncbi:lipopolysaccharide core heptosyltransferase RfaQ [Brenneria alni]|uniref:Lipopolysaccharide core heptosyltransferase RfaQ n=2 Tax=Brenneria alni TaxID=71656 RepID=A0A421DJR0_9GAMM|nr:lipopolysaccharide core heptosyltransferase RfaQ [Brenneria alni]
MLLTTPLISTLKANYPDAKIDVLLYEDTRPILSKNPEINHIYGLQRKHARLLSRVKEFTGIRCELKNNNYDLIINLADQWPIAFLIKSLGSKSLSITRGGKKQKIWRSLFTDCVSGQGEHIIEHNLSLLSSLALSKEKIKNRVSLYYDKSDEDAVFNKNTDLLNKKYVVIQPTARQSFKCWDNEKFAKVIDYLKSGGIEVVLTCGPSKSDLDMVAEISELCSLKPVTSLAGKTSFLELAALIDKAELYIGVDSAPMHMAAALNTPLVSLFGPTNHKLWRPWSEKSVLIWAGDYQPMPERKNLDRNKKYLSCIPAKDVIQAAAKLLGWHGQFSEKASDL